MKREEIAVILKRADLPKQIVTRAQAATMIRRMLANEKRRPLLGIFSGRRTPTLFYDMARRSSYEPIIIRATEASRKYEKALVFFLPLGISASLVTISHVIINSTLSRAANPESIIASYAIAMSLLAITERPAVLLRQTCSTLVRDKRSFKSTLTVAQLVFACIMLLGFIISYTPVGTLIFKGVFGVSEDNVHDVIRVYKVLMFVSLFSGIRCLYHGVIIYNLRTKWLTIGMAIRLAGMYALSLYFIHTGVTSGVVGAIIFLFGMMIEAAVSYSEGRLLVRKMPEKLDNHPVENKHHVFSFTGPYCYPRLYPYGSDRRLMRCWGKHGMRS